MGELLDFARERLGKVIEVTLPGRAAPSKVQVRVPVGTDAVEFMADVRKVMDANTRLVDAVEAKASDAKLSGFADELQVEVNTFVGRWIPRLVDELADANERDVASLVRRTGGTESPFVQVLYDMVPASVGQDDEGLDPLPFSLPGQPGNPSTQ